MRNGLWSGARGTCGHCCPRLPLGFSLRLVTAGAPVYCLLYVLVSYCLPDIYINQLQAQKFRTSLVTNAMNHIKTLWHLLWLSEDADCGLGLSPSTCLYVSYNTEGLYQRIFWNHTDYFLLQQSVIKKTPFLQVKTMTMSNSIFFFQNSSEFIILKG